VTLLFCIDVVYKHAWGTLHLYWNVAASKRMLQWYWELSHLVPILSTSIHNRQVCMSC